MTFFKAAILSASTSAKPQAVLGHGVTFPMGVKVWVKSQSTLTHIISMSTRTSTPQIADRVSPVDSFSIFRHSLEKTNV